MKQNTSRYLKLFFFLAIFIGSFVYLYYFNLNLVEKEKDEEEEEQEQQFDNEDFRGITIYGINITFVKENYSLDLLNKYLTDSWYLHIMGNVKEEFYIGISYLQDGAWFHYLDRIEYTLKNTWGTVWHRDFSGVTLDSLFNTLDCLRTNSTRLRFESIDNYKSPELPIRIILDNPDTCLMANKEEGYPIPPMEEEGDGPLKSMIQLEIIENDAEVIEIFNQMGQNFVSNGVYAVKYCTTIRIL